MPQTLSLYIVGFCECPVEFYLPCDNCDVITDIFLNKDVFCTVQEINY